MHLGILLQSCEDVHKNEGLKSQHAEHGSAVSSQNIRQQKGAKAQRSLIVHVPNSMYVVHEKWTCHFTSLKIDGLAPIPQLWLLNGISLAIAHAYLMATQAHCRSLLEAEGTLQSVPNAAASAYQLGPGDCHPCHL